jgi:hypothetical protein
LDQLRFLGLLRFLELLLFWDADSCLDLLLSLEADRFKKGFFSWKQTVLRLASFLGSEPLYKFLV